MGNAVRLKVLKYRESDQDLAYVCSWSCSTTFLGGLSQF